MIRQDIDWLNLSKEFLVAEPFNHIVIDDFWLSEIAEELYNEFPKYNDISNFFSFSVKELHENNIKLSWTKPNRNWGEQIERTMTLLKNEILLDY
jgi:hypothetical protein